MKQTLKINDAGISVGFPHYCIYLDKALSFAMTSSRV